MHYCGEEVECLLFLLHMQSVCMESFVKRPHSEETEADLLREQDEFLKTKCTPSAQVVRVTRPGDKRKSESANSASDNHTQG